MNCNISVIHKTTFSFHLYWKLNLYGYNNPVCPGAIVSVSGSPLKSRGSFPAGS
jgi:hypothetical protein